MAKKKKGVTIKKENKASLKIKKRNTSLTIWLWIILILNLIIGASYFLYDFSAYYPNAEPFIFKVFGLLALFNVYLMYLLLNWKKVAFYIFCIVELFVFSIYYSIGIPIKESVFGLLSFVVLYALMRPQWKLFK